MLIRTVRPAVVEPLDAIDHLVGRQRFQQPEATTPHFAVGDVRRLPTQDDAGVISATEKPLGREPWIIGKVVREQTSSLAGCPSEVVIVFQRRVARFLGRDRILAGLAHVLGQERVDVVIEVDAERPSYNRHALLHALGHRLPRVGARAGWYVALLKGRAGDKRPLNIDKVGTLQHAAQRVP